MYYREDIPFEGKLGIPIVGFYLSRKWVWVGPGQVQVTDVHFNFDA